MRHDPRWDTPIFEGCDARFSDAEAVSAYNQMRAADHAHQQQRRDQEEARRRQVIATRAAPEETDDPDEIIRLLQIIITADPEKPRARFQNPTPTGHARIAAGKAAWRKLAAIGVFGAPSGEIVSVRLRTQNPFAAAICRETRRRPAWECVIQSTDGFLDADAKPWTRGRGVFTNSPREGHEQSFLLGAGEVLGKASVETVSHPATGYQPSGKSPRKGWLWHVQGRDEAVCETPLAYWGLSPDYGNQSEPAPDLAVIVLDRVAGN